MRDVCVNDMDCCEKRGEEQNPIVELLSSVFNDTRERDVIFTPKKPTIQEKNCDQQVFSCRSLWYQTNNSTFYLLITRQSDQKTNKIKHIRENNG